MGMMAPRSQETLEQSQSFVLEIPEIKTFGKIRSGIVTSAAWAILNVERKPWLSKEQIRLLSSVANLA